MGDKQGIVVTIVHIEGPLKGEIQEFSDPEIRIGRNPDCQVRFPADSVTISRDHARIVREGNRFKLVNHSANYTYVSGKTVKEAEEAYLKSGDWLMFAEGGPKVSFLTKMAEAGRQTEPLVETPPASEAWHPKAHTPEVSPPESSSPQKWPPAGKPAGGPSRQRSPGPHFSGEPQFDDPAPQAIPLVIRYGPTLQRFKKLPITIGKNADCDFTIAHESLSGRHAEIFFRNGQYWVKDLTGAQSVFLDGRSIDPEAPLMPESRLELAHQGPAFRFLGEGRLDQIAE